MAMKRSTLLRKGLSVLLAAALLSGLACSLRSAPVVHAAAPARFQPAQVYPVGSNPCAITSGDFNRDARTDLVTANCLGDNLSVLVNQGDGVFAPAVNYDTGDGPTSVVAADLNMDGWPDLVSTNANIDRLTVYFNDRSGGFQEVAHYTVQDAPYFVTSADFNQDGKPDLAAANGGSSTISVLFNNGSGGFLPQVVYPVGTNPVSLAAEDFNSDGRLDLAAANVGGGTLSVLLGGPAGVFQPAAAIPAGIGPGSLAPGDFNRDGKIDLAVANENNAASLLTGRGDGTFQPPVHYAVGSVPYNVTAGDFNLDGKLDLVSANHNSNTLSVLINDSNLGFRLEETLPVGAVPYSTAAGDFNRDGKLDMAAVNYAGNSVSVLLNDEMDCQTGYFSSPRDVFHFNTASIEDILSADFNQDGLLDHALALDDNTANDHVDVLLRGADGSLTPAWSGLMETANTIRKVETADFNHDGRLDLIATSRSGTASIWLGSGDGTFQTQSTPWGFGDSLNTVAINDYNRDGNLDLALEDEDANVVHIVPGNGDGTFMVRSIGNFATDYDPAALAAGDLNRDGSLDLITVNERGTISVLLGRGDGTFAPRVDYANETGARAIITMDANQDGSLDVLTGNAYSTSLFLGSGSGTLQPRVVIGSDYPVYDFAISDYNQDGAPDIIPLIRRLFFQLFLNNRAGGFSLSSEYHMLRFPAGGGSAGDFNRDGRTDLLLFTVHGEIFYVANISNANANLQIHSVTSGAWEDPGTWQCRVPWSTDDVTIESGDSVTLDSQQFVRNLTIDGSLRMNSSGNLTLLGNWTNQGAFTPGTGTIRFYSYNTAAPTITGATTFHNLIVEANTTLTTADDVTLTGTLTNNGWTSETKTAGGAGRLSYGLAGITLDIAQPGTLTSLNVRRRDADAPYSSPAGQTGRYWSLTPNPGASGFNAALTLPTRFTPTGADLTCRYTGTAWDCGQTSQTANSITRAGITAFSDWTVLRFTPTLMELTANPVTATTYGDPVTFQVSMSTPNGVPTGSVSFFDGSTPLGSRALDASGHASLSTPALGAGRHKIAVQYAGQNQFLPSSATLIDEHIVNPAELTVTAVNAERLYGGANPEFGYTITGFVNGETPLVLNGSPVLTTNATPASPVGASYTITAERGSMNPANYTLRFNPGTLTINPAPLTVRADDRHWRPGEPFPALTYTVSGFVNGEDARVLEGQPDLQTSADAASPAGTYPIIISAGNLNANNYTFTLENGFFTILKYRVYLPGVLR